MKKVRFTALRWLVMASLTVGAASQLGACQLFVKNDATQCSTNADCKDLGLANAVCSSLHTCVLPTGFCEHNAECIDRLGGPAQCVQSNCVSMLSEDCLAENIIGDKTQYSQDNVVVLGLLLGLAGQNTANSLVAHQTIQIATQSFHNALGGLPGLTPTDPRRPVVFLACNEQADWVRAARHLVEDLKVPAILGPVAGNTIIDVVNQVTIPNDVLLLSPAASTYAINLIDRKNLVWRIAGRDVDTAYVNMRLVENFEKVLRAKGTLGPNEPMRVTLLHRGDLQGTSPIPLFLRDLHFNGKSAAENQSSDPVAYQDLDYGYAVGLSNDETVAKTKQAIASVLSFKPHMIINWGLGEAFTNLQNIESSWPADTPYRPYYFMHQSHFGLPWASFVKTNAELRSRIWGGTPATHPEDQTTNAIVANLISSYNSTFPPSPDGGPDGGPGQPVKRLQAAGYSAYDSTYAMLFAALAASKQGKITADNMAAGLHRIGPPGLKIDPTQVGQVFLNAQTELLAGRNVDFYGASGEVLFRDDLDSLIPMFVWCLLPNNQAAVQNVYLNDQNQLVGNVACVAPGGGGPDGGAPEGGADGGDGGGG